MKSENREKSKTSTEEETEVEINNESKNEKENKAQSDIEANEEIKCKNVTNTKSENEEESKALITKEENVNENVEENKKQTKENEQRKFKNENNLSQKRQDLKHTLIENFAKFVLKNSYFLFLSHHRKRALFYRILYNNDLIERSKINLFPFTSDSGLFYETGKKEVNFNPDPISKILRNNDIDSLIELFNEDDKFNIDSFIKESTFETCEIDEKISYICYCAFYGSYKCFDFLIANKVKYTSDLVLFATAGGNVHIIHQCEYIGLDFKRIDVIKIAIQFHRNEVCEWLIETKFNGDDELIDFIELQKVCLNFCNFEMFVKFVEKGFLPDYFLKFIAKYKIKLFYKWMKVCNLFFLVKNEIHDHIKDLRTHYVRNQSEIDEIIQIIFDIFPELQNEVSGLLENDNKCHNVKKNYQNNK